MDFSLTHLKNLDLISKNRRKTVLLKVKARSQLGGDGKDEEELDGHQLKNPTGSKQ